MFLCGLSTVVVPLLPENNYTWLAAASGLFGLSIGANYSLAAVILVDLISLERFVNAYGLLLLFQGVANLIGPPLAGWLSDMTGETTEFLPEVNLIFIPFVDWQALTTCPSILPVFSSFCPEPS